MTHLQRKHLKKRAVIYWFAITMFLIGFNALIGLAIIALTH